MKKTLIILLAFVLIVGGSCDKEDISSTQSAQFIKFYTNYPEFQAADVVETEQGYAVLGTAKISETRSQICLLRTDEYGNSTDSARLFGSGNINRAYSLKVMPDGGYAILGSTSTAGKMAVYLVRTDAEGEVIWNRTIKRNTGSVEAKSFEIGSDESYYLTGYCDTVDKGKEIWWVALDNNGANIWPQRTYGFPGDDEGNHIQVLSDGRLIITGYFTQSSFKNAFVIKTNDRTAFDNIFKMDTTVNVVGNCIRVVDDDNYMLLTTMTTGSVSSVSLRYIYMTSLGWGKHWSKNYSVSNDKAACLISDDDRFYILGTTSYTTSESSMWIITTDDSGNQISRNEFGMYAGLKASSFKKTKDDGFIITGTNQNPEVNNTSVALIKTGNDIAF